MYKIAVYGSLLSSLHNHHYLENSEKLGTFKTEPIFNLYNLGSFPGLKENGDTSIVMEVYNVDENTLKNINRLEGYNENGENNNFYDRKEIITPFGNAFCYFFVPEVEEDRKVKTGDWKNYIKNK